MASLLGSLETIVTPQRLQRYRSPGASDVEVVTNYLWNIRLSEALLPSIALFEVCLRNAAHATLTSALGTEYWFQQVIQPARWATVERVIAELAGVSTKPPIQLPSALPPSGKIIAQLTFGFWPHLFSRQYRRLWWSPSDPILAKVLPAHPKVTASTRSDLHLRLMYFNELRNRAMHHEAVFQGVATVNHPIVPVDRLHAELLETLGWINPDALRLLSCIDQFPSVFSSGGKADIESALRAEYGLP